MIKEFTVIRLRFVLDDDSIPSILNFVGFFVCHVHVNHNLRWKRGTLRDCRHRNTAKKLN